MVRERPNGLPTARTIRFRTPSVQTERNSSSGKAHGISGSDLWLLPLQGERRAQPLVQTPFMERNADISPDGRWLAYQSNDSGQFEVYVRPFPNVNDNRWQVSTGGGTVPLWARNGREMFFMTLRGESLMAAAILKSTGSAAFRSGTPIKLFDTRGYFAPTGVIERRGRPDV